MSSTIEILIVDKLPKLWYIQQSSTCQISTYITNRMVLNAEKYYKIVLTSISIFVKVQSKNTNERINMEQIKASLLDWYNMNPLN